MARKGVKSGVSRDWAEYVYQSDMTQELYAATTSVYELVDYLRLHPDAEIPKWLKPFIKDMKRVAEDPIRQMTEDDHED